MSFGPETRSVFLVHVHWSFPSHDRALSWMCGWCSHLCSQWFLVPESMRWLDHRHLILISNLVSGTQWFLLILRIFVNITYVWIRTDLKCSHQPVIDILPGVSFYHLRFWPFVPRDPNVFEICFCHQIENNMQSRGVMAVKIERWAERKRGNDQEWV